MEKKMENEMKTAIYRVMSLIRPSLTVSGLRPMPISVACRPSEQCPKSFPGV